MSVVIDHTDASVSTAHLEALTAGRRRRMLRLLAARTTPLSETQLATRLAAMEQGVTADAVDSNALRSVQVSVQHCHLPKLVELGLVERDEAANTVTLTEDAVVEHGALEQLLHKDGDEWDAIIASLADSRRRAILERLEAASGSQEVATLAEHIVDAEATEVTERAVADVRTSLRHVHLPKLEEAGLVEYDRDAGTVAYHGHDGLPAMTTL